MTNTQVVSEIVTRLPSFLWRGFGRVLSANQSLAWIDQGAVSATNFLVLVMIGRTAALSELGAYAIGVSLIAVLIATQGSLVTRPYSIRFHRSPEFAKEHATGAIVSCVLLSVVAATLFLIGAVTIWSLALDGSLIAICLVLAAVIPFVLLREFARQFVFAHLKVFPALCVDLFASALTALLLAWLAWQDALSAITAFSVMGVASGLAGLGWLYFWRNAFCLHLGQFRAVLADSWQLGKWLLSSQVALQVEGYVTHWLSLVIAGAAATGVYVACLSVIAFANPILFGFINILTPKAVRAFQAGGGAALRRQATRDALFLVSIMSVFCLFVSLAGGAVLELLYPSLANADNTHLLTVLALASLAASVGVPASTALVSAECARIFAAITFFSAGLSLLLVWWLLTIGGLLGAAYGVLGAGAAGSLARWLAFLILIPPRPNDNHSFGGSARRPESLLRARQE